MGNCFIYGQSGEGAKVATGTYNSSTGGGGTSYITLNVGFDPDYIFLMYASTFSSQVYNMGTANLFTEMQKNGTSLSTYYNAGNTSIQEVRSGEASFTSSGGVVQITLWTGIRGVTDYRWWAFKV